MCSLTPKYAPPLMVRLLLSGLLPHSASSSATQILPTIPENEYFSLSHSLYSPLKISQKPSHFSLSTNNKSLSLSPLCSEPHARESCSVLHHHPFPLVPQHFHHPLPQQDWHPGWQGPDVWPAEILPRLHGWAVRVCVFGSWWATWCILHLDDAPGCNETVSQIRNFWTNGGRA